MRRRAFLATAGTGLVATLAGCARPEGSLVMTAVDDEGLAGRYAVAAADLPTDERDLVAAAVAGTEPTVEDVSPPIATARPIAFEGAYYRLSRSIVGRRQAVRYAVEVTYGPGTPTRDLGAVEYANLPAADRDALDGLVPPDEGLAPATDGAGRETVGKGYVYPPDADSVFVPDQQFDVVVRDGRRYAVSVGDPTDVTVRTYRYSADRVAADAAAMADRLHDRYRFELTGLSAAEREIVAEATGEGYAVGGSVSEAFRSLVDRFRSHEGIEVTATAGTWIALYDGTTYWSEAAYPFASGTPSAES